MRVAAIILVCCASLAIAAKNCPRNEQWSECKGCELSCGQDENTPCPPTCGPPGCECVAKKGFRRNAKGKCVRKNKCGSDSGSSGDNEKCGENMEFNPCGSACPETCADGGVKGNCGMSCVAGCFCKKGFVLEWEHGKCIPRSQCRDPKPRSCGLHMAYRARGTACLEKCEQPPAAICTLRCVAACFCQPRYLVDSDGKRCFRPDDCNSSKSSLACFVAIRLSPILHL